MFGFSCLTALATGEAEAEINGVAIGRDPQGSAAIRGEERCGANSRQAAGAQSTAATESGMLLSSSPAFQIRCAGADAFASASLAFIRLPPLPDNLQIRCAGRDACATASFASLRNQVVWLAAVARLSTRRKAESTAKSSEN